DAGIEGELLKFRATAVVEDVDVEFLGGPVHVERAQRGVTHHIERLVVGGNEHVDVRPFLRIVGQGDGSAAQRPDGLEISQEENDKRVGFSTEQAKDEKGVECAGMAGGILEE